MKEFSLMDLNTLSTGSSTFANATSGILNLIKILGTFGSA